MPHKEIRATYDSQTITVYQAFSSGIAEAAVTNQTFVAPFSSQRMTPGPIRQRLGMVQL